MNKLTVITVLRSGPDWKPEFVYNFKKGLDKNLTRPFNFVCFSDIDLDVETVPLLDVGQGFWSKLQLFRPELKFTGPCLYFDLDTIIKGNIDELVNTFENYNFLMLQDPWKPEQSGSGMMWWKGDYSKLWNEFITKPEKQWHNQYCEHPRFGDQGYIIDRVEHKQIQEVINNKTDICKFSKKESSPESKIIIFAGPKRKPWLNLNHPDIVNYWKNL
jgi:hypothetical protein